MPTKICCFYDLILAVFDVVADRLLLQGNKAIWMGGLAALGFLINLYPIPLFFSVALLFGSIAPVASILV